METGYTSFITDGKITTGRDFLMLCARAFGATADMREEPLSKPIPEKFDCDYYHVKRLAEEEAELKKYQNMSDEEWQNWAMERYENAMKDHEKRVAECQRKKDAYTKVRREVFLWNPPTQDHNDLKRFALEQIDMCLRDCKTDREPPERLDFDAYRTEMVEMAKSSIAYHKKCIEDERERVASRNKWIADLRESLR